MSWPLINSILIGFRAPSNDDALVFCSDRTIKQVNQITKLADSTNHVKIACSPNIWSHAYTKMVIVDPGSTISSMSSVSTHSDPTSVSDVTDELVKGEIPETPKVVESAPKVGFNVHPDSKFFVIKSFSEGDVDASKIHSVWTSTNLGNERLNNAYLDTPEGDIFLFFLVNGSSKFCGVAKMTGCVDFSKKANIWVEASRWKGIFPLEWLMVKNVPNEVFRYLRVPANGNKCVTHSRDTQQVPFDVGVTMLKIFCTFRHGR